MHFCSTQLPPWSLKVLRSSQLDAQRLDAELHTMLQEQFMSIFKLFQPVRVDTSSCFPMTAASTCAGVKKAL